MYWGIESVTGRRSSPSAALAGVILHQTTEVEAGGGGGGGGEDGLELLGCNHATFAILWGHKNIFLCIFKFIYLSKSYHDPKKITSKSKCLIKKKSWTSGLQPRDLCDTLGRQKYIFEYTITAKNNLQIFTT